MSTKPAPAHLEVAIVGQGRLGSTVSAVLEGRGHHVHRIGRGQEIPAAPVVWLTVPDAEIAGVASRCGHTGVLLHASGASTLDVLGDHPCAGSLHPLMTFPGGESPPPPIPAAIAGSPRAREAAGILAHVLGWTPFEVTGDRRAYHAAAVIAGNFGTTLLAQASKILVGAGVASDIAPALLAPLAIRSLQNAVALGPERALTGPVVRGDTTVIEDHRAVLAATHPEALAMYDALVQATWRIASDNFHEIPPDVD